jgi:hypothetical protein
VLELITQSFNESAGPQFGSTHPKTIKNMQNMVALLMHCNTLHRPGG